MLFLNPDGSHLLHNRTISVACNLLNFSVKYILNYSSIQFYDECSILNQIVYKLSKVEAAPLKHSRLCSHFARDGEIRDNQACKIPTAQCHVQ